MSRYPIPHEVFAITVGWDNPLQTFFVQVRRPATAAGAEDTDVLWVGTAPQALLSVESVRHALQPYAVLPRAIAAALQRDLDDRTAPTPLQRRVWALIDRR